MVLLRWVDFPDTPREKGIEEIHQLVGIPAKLVGIQSARSPRCFSEPFCLKSLFRSVPLDALSPLSAGPSLGAELQ